jgi:hypothetical protein
MPVAKIAPQPLAETTVVAAIITSANQWTRHKRERERSIVSPQPD